MVRQEKVIINDEHVANSFSDASLFVALRAAEASASETGSYVLSMPEILASFSGPIGRITYSCNSEEAVGRTPQGTSVMIEVHGGGILTSERIEAAHDIGLATEDAVRLAKSEVRNLLKGKLTGEVEIPVYSFSAFKAGIRDLPRRYAVVMDFAEAEKAASSYLPVESLRDNSLVIVRAGGVAEASAFVDIVAQRHEQYGNYHPFEYINARDNFVYLPLVTDHGHYAALSSSGLSTWGCFLVKVVPEAQVGAERRAPLEDMVNVRLPSKVVDAMRTGEKFTYEGRTYCLKSEK